MNELRIFSNEKFGNVRIVLVHGEPWFVAKDVAVALGYQKPFDAISTNVSEMDTTLVGVMDSIGRIQQTKVINESGLYDLIFESRLPSAREFRRWVTSEVLPSIRKTGSYVAKPDSYTIEDPVARAERWIEEQKEKRALEAKNQELLPKAHVYDSLISSKLLVNFRDAAKEIGISQSQFTGWLKENKYVYTTQAGELRPMEAYMKSGLFQMKPYQNPYNGYCGNRTYLTPTGLATFKLMLDTSDMNRENMPKHGGRNWKKRKTSHEE